MHFPIELKSIFHLNPLPEGNMSMMTNISNGCIRISRDYRFIIHKKCLKKPGFFGVRLVQFNHQRKGFQKIFHVSMDFLLALLRKI